MQPVAPNATGGHAKMLTSKMSLSAIWMTRLGLVCCTVKHLVHLAAVEKLQVFI